MGNKKKSSFSFESDNIFFYIIRRWRFFAAVVIAAVLVSSIVSLLIPPRYKSTVILFPAASVPVSQVLLAPGYSGSRVGITSFGEEEEAEQVLQILNSEVIRDAVVKQFNLMEHYGIDTSSRTKRTQLLGEYKKNFSFRRTEFLSIEISVLDKDRQMAADIANYVASLIDSVMNGMKRARAVKAYEIVAREYEDLQKHVNMLQDSVEYMRKMGIPDYGTQIEVLTDQYAQALIKGNSAAARTLKEKLDLFNQFGSRYIALRTNLDLETRQLNELRNRYIQAKVEAEQDLPNKFIVDSAVPAEKKSKPVRWLIVVVSSFSAFIFALIALLFFENLWKKIRREI